MLAIPPLCSANCAIGSACSRVTPSGPVMAYLYGVRDPRPATKPAHTPSPTRCSGRPSTSQWFQGPATATCRACGAHTANAVPACPPTSVDVAAQHLPQPPVGALGVEVEVEVGGQAHVATGPRTSRSMPASGIDTLSGRWPSS